MSRKLKYLLLAALLLPGYGAAAQTRAVVEFSVATLHRSPDYESPVESQCLMGSTVSVTGEDGYWRKVTADEPAYEGWTEELSIVTMSEAGYAEYEAAPKYVCVAESARIWSDPSGRSAYVGEITLGGIVCKGLGPTGKAVRKGKFLQVKLPSGRTGWVERSSLQDYGQWLAASELDAGKIIATAMSLLGKPYIWGGNSTKGVDCSGLTWLSFHMNGLDLPRDASQQCRLGQEVTLEEALPGDLIFFGTPAEGDSRERVSHVAIYIGGGRIVQSSQVVRINSLDPSEPDFYDHKPVLHVKRLLK